MTPSEKKVRDEFLRKIAPHCDGVAPSQVLAELDEFRAEKQAAFRSAVDATMSLNAGLWGIDPRTNAQRHRIAAYAACKFAEEIDTSFITSLTFADSPLSAVFETWWNMAGALDALAFPQWPWHLWLSGEYESNGFRLDFAVFDGNNNLMIGVELDGRQYHYRSQADIDKRDRRDRVLMQAGWRLFHFSASELYRDPKTAVEEVRSFAIKTRAERT